MANKKFISLTLSLIILLTATGISPVAVNAASWDRQQYYLDSIAEYGEYDLSDSQFIPDDEFFGKWDDEKGEWEKVPYFYYEEFPLLSAVEEAAKAGDYAKCKEEILAYYREKHKGYKIDLGEREDLSARARARSESAFDNCYVRGCTISGKVHFTPQNSWQTMELYEDVKALVTSGAADKKLKYQLVAGKKDGYRVEISNEEGYKPYITATINGENRTFPVSVATYVDNGEPDTSHNGISPMLVEESVTSIGNPVTLDENTKRTLIQFDLSEHWNVSPNDQVAGATLHLYGRMVEDDIEDEPRVPTEFKSVYVSEWTGETSIDPNTTFRKYFDAKVLTFYCFDGEACFRAVQEDPDIPSVLNVGISLGNVVPDVTNGYIKTGDEAFAFHAIRMFVRSILDFGTYEEFHSKYKKGIFNSLSVGKYGFTCLNHIHRLMESKYMTPEVFTIMIKHAHLRARWLVENWGGPEDSHNWGSYSVNGLESTCFYYPEFRDVYGEVERDENGEVILQDKELGGSVKGGWFEVANYRRSYKVKDDAFSDGSSVEGSLSYATEGLSNYIGALDKAKQFGIDGTLCYQDEDAKAALERSMMFMISMLNPRFGSFQVGDESKGWASSYSSNLKPYTELIDNPFLEFVVTNRESGKEPSFKTSFYDGAKVGTFRNSWADDYAIAAQIQARGGGSHNHNDDLALTLCAYGNYLLVDPRMGNYVTTEKQERWVSSSRGHNTVEINNAVMRGYRNYDEQYTDTSVFALDEEGNPRKDADGIEMTDEEIFFPIKQQVHRQGDLHSENREANDVYDFLRAETISYTDNNASSLKNEDFKVFRDVLFLRTGYFIVTDYFEPEYGKTSGLHDYKQLWHFLPKANLSVDEETNVIRTNFNGEANLAIASVKNNDTLKPMWKYGLYAAERSKFEVCKYSYFKQQEEGIATFNTLLYPTPANQDADLSTKKLELDITDEKADAFKATITDRATKEEKELYFYTLFDEKEKKEIPFGEYETNGSLALAEMNDKGYINAVLRRGSYLKDILDNEYAIYSEENIEDIGVSWNLDEVDIAYDIKDAYNNAIDLSKLTIKANTTTKTVRLNGKEIDFNQKGRYIYFGKEPILDKEEILPDTGNDENESENDNSSGNHASQGGNGGSFGGGGGGGIKAPSKEELPAPKPSDTYEKELKGHWAQKEISSLVDSKVIEGFGDGTLGLKNNITRAQFITMLVRALGVDVKKYSSSFADVSPDSWYADFMETAYKNGWIEGDGKNSHPERNITREEIAKILVLAYEGKNGKIESVKQNGFADNEKISSWAIEYVDKAFEKGLINGMGNGEFCPRDNAKREQAMVIIYRLLNN